jgi:hypothetical protein
MCLIKTESSAQSRLERKAVPPKQSGVTTSPLDRVTLILIKYKYFEYLTGFLLWRRYRRQFGGYIFFGGIFP